MRGVAGSGAVLVTLAVLLAGITGAEAHAFLERADPRAGSTVHGAPAQVRLWFTERLEPAFSSVRIVNAAGHRVDSGDAKADPSAPKELLVSVPPLPPGPYKVLWRVTMVDGHVTHGDFTFRVAP